MSSTNKTCGTNCISLHFSSSDEYCLPQEGASGDKHQAVFLLPEFSLIQSMLSQCQVKTQLCKLLMLIYSLYQRSSRVHQKGSHKIQIVRVKEKISYKKISLTNTWSLVTSSAQSGLPHSCGYNFLEIRVLKTNSVIFNLPKTSPSQQSSMRE